MGDEQSAGTTYEKRPGWFKSGLTAEEIHEAVSGLARDVETHYKDANVSYERSGLNNFMYEGVIVRGSFFEIKVQYETSAVDVSRKKLTSKGKLTGTISVQPSTPPAKLQELEKLVQRFLPKKVVQLSK